MNSSTRYNQWTVFPPDFDPDDAGLTFEPSPPGDFDANNLLDAADVDLLVSRFYPPWSYQGEHGWWLPDSASDFDRDQTVDQQDLRIWVKSSRTRGMATPISMANSHGDFVQAFQAGKYEAAWREELGELHNGAGWSEGDWNGDGVFDPLDFVIGSRMAATSKVRERKLPPPCRSQTPRCC